ncbi:MAG: glycosyltransferase family 4 protein [Rhizobiaceae bacterium]|nr:glycosyltransferase family 4 protein [Rhizobiaceae bacterium]
MRIAFHSPIKPPDHPVPSGDRLMARLLIRALRLGGAEVDVVSEFRSFRREPPRDGLAGLLDEAGREIERTAASWRRAGPPDLFFAYHPYYKAPDLIGPELARRFSIPYVTAESSYSSQRDAGGWAEMQAHVRAALEAAAVNICMTARDREGLAANVALARTAMLAPFIDAAPYLAHPPRPEPGRLVTVAMMRPGDKLDSYRMLAAALATVDRPDWSLSVIGDGSARGEVEAMFSGFAPGRIVWHGELGEPAVASELAQGSLYVWPGCGEAYGLAYLEAQAAGLPVVAQAIAGVPSVVIGGRTGILTQAGDVEAFAAAIRRLLSSPDERLGLAANARGFATGERSLAAASSRLVSIITEFAGVTV